MPPLLPLALQQKVTEIPLWLTAITMAYSHNGLQLKVYSQWTSKKLFQTRCFLTNSAISKFQDNETIQKYRSNSWKRWFK